MWKCEMALARKLHVIAKSIYSLSSPRRPTGSNQIANLRFLSRNITTTQLLHEKEKEVSVTFVSTNGDKMKVKGKVGLTMWDIAVQNNILKQLWWCESFGICCACHVTFTKENYGKLPEKHFDEYTHLTNAVPNTTKTSRLSCQIKMTEDLDGIEANLTTPDRL